MQNNNVKIVSLKYVLADVKNQFGNQFKCVDGKFYQFTPSNLWEIDESATCIRNLLSTNIVQQLEAYHLALIPHKDDEEIKKKIKVIDSFIKDLKRTNFKDHVVREFSDLVKDNTFIDKLNRQEFIIPIQPNHLFDLRTNEITERDTSCNFSLECNALFLQRPFDKQIAENYEFVDKYFNDLFCNNMQTKKAVLSIFKTIFKGKPTRYLYIFSGSGSNGKSLLLQLIKSIFGKFIDTISKSVVIKQKGNYTNILNTEMEKLQHIRVGFVSELDDNDELNIKSIKEISGGDDIDLRGMRETNKTIKPMSSLLVITNQKPKIPFSNDENDKAIIKRLVNVPFKATFENNSDFENKMKSLTNEVFTYIMTEGELFNNIQPLLSEEMIFEKNEYINENKMDELKSYIDSHLVDCENTKEDKPILLDDFRSSFYDYIKTRNLKYPNLTSTKFTKTCKSFGLAIKESNSKTRIYQKKWIEELDEDEENTTFIY